MAAPIVTGESTARGSHRGAEAARAGRGGPRLAHVGYIVAALFILVPLLDIATLGLPAQPGDPAWRFGVLGAASNYLLTASFGLALACWTAAWYRHARTLRVLAVGSTLFGLVLFAALVEFALDVLQLRGAVSGLDQQAFRIGSAKAGIKYILLGGAAVVIGVSAWRAGGQLRRAG